MKKVFIGVGHGGSDPGAVGNGLNEKDINLNIAKSLKAELIKYDDIEVLMSREIDEDDPISNEVSEANAFNPDIAIDVHTNAGGGKGFEVYYQTNVNKDNSLKLANLIEVAVLDINQNSRGCKTKLNSYGTDYFGFLRSITCPAIILECAFIDNSSDFLMIETVEKQELFGKAYAKGVLKYFDIEEQEEVDTSNLTLIKGSQVASKSQMSEFLKSKNSDYLTNFGDLAYIYLNEGNAENIRGDIAFAQACLETGYFKFGGDVKAEQNNFCGLGATGNGECGNSFETPTIGVTAHIQHLKAYANEEDIYQVLVDPRFSYVERGVSPYVEWLGQNENPDKKGWATDIGYGDKILGVLNEILNVAISEESTSSGESTSEETEQETKKEFEIPTWATNGVDWAVSNNVIYGDENGDLMLDNNLTKMELCVILERLFNK